MRIWSTPTDYPNDLVGEYDEEKSSDRFELRDGVSLDTSVFGVPEVRFDRSFEQIQRFAVLPNTAMVPLIRQDIEPVIREICGDSVQFIPALVKTNAGSYDAYFFLNVLAKMPIVDYSQSAVKYVAGTKKIRKFDRLRLVPEAEKYGPICRDSDYKSYVFVSVALSAVAQTSKWNGVDFISPESVVP